MKWPIGCLLIASFVGASTARSQPRPDPCKINPCPAETVCIPQGVTRQCRPIPTPLPEPKTVFNQAWTSIGKTAYAFVVHYDPLKVDDGHVFMNIFVKGSASSAWYDLGAPPSSDGTPGALTGPSAVAVEGLIFLTVANKDHAICLNQGHDTPATWTGWVCR